MKEKKLLIIIIILVLVIVLAVGGMIAAYAFTDFLKTDKQLFLKYISKNEELIEQFNDAELENYIKKQDSTAYSNEGKITLNTSGASTDKTLNMIKNASVTFNGGTDSTNNYRYQNININYSDTEKVNAEYIQLQDHYGLKINDVTNKYLAVENNNLKEWATKMRIDEEVVKNIPNKLDLKVLKNIFTKEEIKQIKTKYLKVIEPELTDKMFSQDKENDSNVYILTLTKNDLTNIASKILTTLKDDEMIMSKIRHIMLIDAGISEEAINDAIKELKAGIQEKIDDLNNENNIVTSENASTNVEYNVNIKIFVQKGKLQKTEISTSNTSDKLTITNIKNGMQIEVIEDDTNIPIVMAMQKIKNTEGLTYSMVTSEASKQLMSVSMKYNGLNTEQVQQKIEVNFDAGDILTSVEETQNQGDVNNSLTDEPTNSSTDSLTTNSATDSANRSITLIYENTKKFENNLQKQNVTTSDMIILNTAPNIESISNLLTKVWERFLQVNTERLMKAMNTSQNSSEIPEQSTNTETNPTDSTNNNTNDINNTNTINDGNTNSIENTNNTNTDFSNLAGNTNTENSIDNTNSSIENNSTNTDTNSVTSNTNNIMPDTNNNTNTYPANVTHQTTN